MSCIRLLGAWMLGLLVAAAADAGVVNVDYMESVLPQFGDQVYAVDNGILSSTGGTFWNGADAFHGVNNAKDEFGAATTVNLVVNVSGQIFTGAPNELQDDGITSGGVPANGFDFRNLQSGGVYDLALYVFASAGLGDFTTLDIVHAGGTLSLATNGDTTFTVPGQAGKDYLLASGLSPVELAPGVFGFRIRNINEQGAVLGAQLRGPLVPEPASVMVLGLGSMVLALRRRRANRAQA